MCTYITNADKLKATKDMVVYKIVKKKFGKYYAPVQDVPYKDNKMSSDIEVEDGWSATFSCIRKGIHSFTKLSDAIDYCNIQLARESTKKYVIVKAIVPKGSTYYEGYTFMAMFLRNEDTNVIVSDSIILTNEEMKCYDSITKKISKLCVHI